MLFFVFSKTGFFQNRRFLSGVKIYPLIILIFENFDAIVHAGPAQPRSQDPWTLAPPLPQLENRPNARKRPSKPPWPCPPTPTTGRQNFLNYPASVLKHFATQCKTYSKSWQDNLASTTLQNPPAKSKAAYGKISLTSLQRNFAMR